MTKDERVTARVTLDQKNFLINTWGSVSSGLQQMMNDYLTLRNNARREIMLIQLSDKDIDIICNAELKNVHPTDYLEVLKYIAKTQDHDPIQLIEKLNRLSSATRFFLDADVRDYPPAVLKNWYVEPDF